MLINTLYNSTTYSETVNSFSWAKNIRPIEKLAEQNGKNDFFKNSSQAQKNQIVSEKLDTINPSYNCLRFQSNTPLAKLYDSTKLFNEIYKNSRKEVLKEKDKTSLQINTSFNSNRMPIGKGFYITANNQNAYSSNSYKCTNLFEEKIKKTYQTGLRKEPGTLLDVTT